MIIQRFQPKPFYRLPDDILSRDAHLSLKELGLYALIADLLAWRDREPGLTLPRGGFRAWAQGCCAEGDRAFHTVWKKLRLAGWLKLARIPRGPENDFMALYQLLQQPDPDTPATRHLTHKEGMGTVAAIPCPCHSAEGFTKVSVSVLTDNTLSLKAKGLWIRVMAEANLEANGCDTEVLKSTVFRKSLTGECVFDTAWKELKTKGYLKQVRDMDEKTGQFRWKYILYPIKMQAGGEPPVLPSGKTGRYPRTTAAVTGGRRAAPARTPEEREVLLSQIRRNVRYDSILDEITRREIDISKRELEEYIRIIAETVCSARKVWRISREDIPQALVRARFMAIDKFQLEYAMESVARMKAVRNPRAYRVTALYNAGDTLSDYLKKQEAGP